MKVVHVSEVSAGGVRGLLDDYASDQVDRGFDVHIVGQDGLARIPGNHHRWRGSRSRPTQAALDIQRLQRLLSQLSPDVVHLHSFFAGVFGRSSRRRLPFPVVYQPHGWAFEAVRTPTLRRTIVEFERWAGSRTDLLATNSADEVSEGRRCGITTPAVTLGVPVDLKWFTPPTAEERTAARCRLGLPDRPLLLCLGRLVRQKGQDILVRAWEQEPVPGADLYLVGAGASPSLERLAPTAWGRTLHAVGPTEDPRTWYYAADVMLLPSRYEGQSVAVSEALACGLPVVAFDVNGARAAICDDAPSAGAVVGAGDATALLAEAARRVDDADLRAGEAEAARFRAERDSDARLVLDRVVAAYRTAIEIHAGRA